jgi:hypothetical protein
MIIFLSSRDKMMDYAYAVAWSVEINAVKSQHAVTNFRVE